MASGYMLDGFLEHSIIPGRPMGQLCCRATHPHRCITPVPLFVRPSCLDCPFHSHAPARRQCVSLHKFRHCLFPQPFHESRMGCALLLGSLQPPLPACLTAPAFLVLSVPELGKPEGQGPWVLTRVFLALLTVYRQGQSWIRGA